MMETRVKKIFQDVDAALTPEEKQARIDIGYRRTAGQHVIIELKRPSVCVTLSRLIEQIRKYKNEFQRILDDIGETRNPIEIVILLGKRPSDWNDPGGSELVPRVLATYDARFVLYDELLQDAYKAYEDFVQQRRNVDVLQQIFEAIDDFGAEA